MHSNENKITIMKNDSNYISDQEINGPIYE